MKIALFTPVDSGSAIARVSGLLASALRDRGHEVVTVATDDLEPPTGAARADLDGWIHWRQQTAIRDLVWEADLVFHQIGNHYGFHAGSLFWLERIGGAVALHDFFVGDLFLQFAEGNDLVAGEVLRRWYDLDLSAFRTMAHSGRFARLAWPSLALTEWIASQADAVVAHSGFGLDAVRRATDATIRVVPLIGELEPLPPRRADHWRAGATEGPLRLLTFGHIIPNKLCDDLITAVASDRAVRETVVYRIAGQIDDGYRERLEDLAGALGVTVEITGALTRDALLDELAQADLIACVRRPTLESGSASAVESMLSGTPLLVLDEGFYSSLPHDLVVSVDGSDVQKGLHAVLRDIVSGRRDIRALGAAARAWAEATFRAEPYAEAVETLAAPAAEHRVLREMDETYTELVNGSPAVRERYANDTAIFRE